MKHLIVLLLMIALLCGCAQQLPEIDVQEILDKVSGSIDTEELKQYAQQGADALMEKFPALKTLTDQQRMKELLKEQGLDLLGKYIESTDATTQEKARKVGEILKILDPELTDEVDGVLGE